MDVRIISIVLVIAIVICILALIAISVIPAMKKKKSSAASKEPKKPKEPKKLKEPKKPKEPEEPKEPETPKEPEAPKEPKKPKEPKEPKELKETVETVKYSKEEAEVIAKSISEKEEVKASELKADTQKPSNVVAPEKETEAADTKQIQESVKKPETAVKPEVKRSSGSLNPPRKNPPKENTAQTTAQNEITRFKSFSNKDACMALLSLIAEEYSKQQPKKDEVVINYLKDDALELVCDHGIFYLNNEEIFLNGNMLEDTHVFVIPTGKRVIIRFDVNFSLPEGYELSLCSNDAMLAKKGLQLISANENSRNSLRVSLVSTKECTITKTDHLFYVKIMKELIQ
mgnify:FL=1